MHITKPKNVSILATIYNCDVEIPQRLHACNFIIITHANAINNYIECSHTRHQMTFVLAFAQKCLLN